MTANLDEYEASLLPTYLRNILCSLYSCMIFWNTISCKQCIFIKTLGKFWTIQQPGKVPLGYGGIFYPQLLGGTVFTSPCCTSTSDPSLTAASRSAAVTAFCASEVSFLRLSWHTTIAQLCKLNMSPQKCQHNWAAWKKWTETLCVIVIYTGISSITKSDSPRWEIHR